MIVGGCTISVTVGLILYWSVSEEEGKVYIDICIAYKNLDTKDRSAEDILDATLIYDDRYQYTGFSMIEEESRSDFTYSNITNIAPLATEYVHYLFKVPVEVETSSESIEITFTIGGHTYNYTVR